MKLDSSGDTLWTKTWDLGAVDFATGIIQFQNDNYLITAISLTASCGNIFRQGFASYFVIDSLGNVMKIQRFVKGIKNKFLNVCPTIDGGEIITVAFSIKNKFPYGDTV